MYINKLIIPSYVDINPKRNNEHMRDSCELINGHMHKLLVGITFFVFHSFVGRFGFEVIIAIIDNGN